MILFLWYLITTPVFLELVRHDFPFFQPYFFFKITGVIKIFIFHLQTLSILSATILDIDSGMDSFVDITFVSASFMLPALLRIPIVIFVGIALVMLLPADYHNKVTLLAHEHSLQLCKKSSFLTLCLKFVDYFRFYVYDTRHILWS
eukprot:TRINITY_DN1609_c0_g1_i10.p2 TRINITY_DN1609_c0_g1~~TRINITY_DN1609_c0_g1_i10.p2  ORF type:complete len:146 (-),score=17.59 TRINITY_DN1609_c0_g1_i10:1268-1705(-)